MTTEGNFEDPSRMPNGPDDNKGEEDIDSYIAPVIQLSKAEASAIQNTSSMQALLRRFVPSSFDLGRGYFDEGRLKTITKRMMPPQYRYKNRGDLIFRFVFLPNDPDERARRVTEISKAGTDRTDQNYPKERLVLDRYTGTAEWAGVNPLDLIDCYASSAFYDLIGDGSEEDGPRPLFDFLDKTFYSGSKDQALLVFDGKTENGVTLVRRPEYIFRNPQHKNKALLGIITVKSD